MAEEREVTDSDAKCSGKRRRLKGLLQRIQQQVEFYLGDANLPKDKFLQEKVKQHPEGYVSLELIASFNKMKTITTDLALVVQAVEHSTVLQLSEDRKWVKRASPLPTSSDVDVRTIYIENLPKQASHDFVRNLLKRFGTISYISLPRHKTSSFIKGFGFVEFSSSQEAQDAVTFFKTHQGHGSAQSIPPQPTDREEITTAKVQSGKEQHVSEVVSTDVAEECVVTMEITKEEVPIASTAKIDRDIVITTDVTGNEDTSQGDVPISSEVTSQGDIPFTSEVTTQGDVPITSEVTTRLQVVSGYNDGDMGSTTDQAELSIKEHHEGKEVVAVATEASTRVAGIKRSHCSDDEGTGTKRKRVESEGEESRAAELLSGGETEEGEEEKGAGKRKRGKKKKKKKPGLQELELRVMSKCRRNS